MSAFQVSDTTIHTIVDFIARNATSFNGQHIGPNMVNFPRLLPEDRNTLTELGKALLRLNIAALVARYRDEPEEPSYTFRQVMPATEIQAFKSIDCLLYQCSEGDVPKEPLYKELDAFGSELAERIVRRLPAYDAAKWDLPESTYAVVRL